MTIRDFQYTPGDVECVYCTEFKANSCQAAVCPWFKERMQAGVIDNQNLINFFADSQSACKDNRVTITRHLVWKDQMHYQRFWQLTEMLKDYPYYSTNPCYCVFFLLTSNEQLMFRLMGCFTPEGLDFGIARLKGLSDVNYALFKIAKSLFTKSAEVSVDELADPVLIGWEAFELTVNAILIERYGLAAFSLCREEGRHGCLQS